jgi:hypothetical protein
MFACFTFVSSLNKLDLFETTCSINSQHISQKGTAAKVKNGIILETKILRDYLSLLLHVQHHMVFHFGGGLALLAYIRLNLK